MIHHRPLHPDQSQFSTAHLLCLFECYCKFSTRDTMVRVDSRGTVVRKSDRIIEFFVNFRTIARVNCGCFFFFFEIYIFVSRMSVSLCEIYLRYFLSREIRTFTRFLRNEIFPRRKLFAFRQLSICNSPSPTLKEGNVLADLFFQKKKKETALLQTTVGGCTCVHVEQRQVF